MTELPEGWSKHFSKSSKRDYFFHAATNRKQWHFPDKNQEEDKNEIKNYYSSLKELPVFQKTSKAFLNFLKNVIIEEFSYDLCCDYTKDFKFNVLDLGCGDGSDILKWKRLNVSEYKGVDLCENQLKECIQGDFTLPETWEKLSGKKYDVITCFFSQEYAFSEIQSIRNFLNGISSYLSERGRVLIICSDSEYWRTKQKRSWGNLKISELNEKISLCGDRFFKNCPEWWVHKETLLTETQSAGMKLLLDINLATFSAFIGVDTQRSTRLRHLKWEQSYAEALKSMYGQETVNSDAWAECSLYKLYVFLKSENKSFGTSIKREIENWTTAVKEGKVDSLFSYI